MPGLLILLSIVLALLGFIPFRLYPRISVFGSLLSFAGSVYLLFNIPEAQFLRFEWFHTGEYALNLSLDFQPLTLGMTSLVCLINLLVQAFSLRYMAHERRIQAYFASLQLFTASMLGIVLSGSLLLSFLAWELVGFSSWLLIGFWYEKSTTGPAATKAFMLNRLADVGFLSGILILFNRYHTFELQELSQLIQLDDPAIALAGIFMLLGAFGKSAQFPFQAWLPDAMVGPTPASAMIHAATMVAAGVFFAARISPLLAEQALLLAAIAGMLTAIPAALAALAQTDIKKVLAYSTLSQLGLMMMGIGSGAPDQALFHLFTHAFFKCGLFLSAAVILHHRHHLFPEANDQDLQDIRLIQGLEKDLPLVGIVFALFSLSLSGFPLTSGFLSKESLLEAMPLYVLIPALITVFLTPLYSMGLFFRLFPLRKGWGSNWIPKGSWLFMIPLGILALLSTGLAFGPLKPNLSVACCTPEEWLLPVSLILSFSGMLTAWLLRNKSIPDWPILRYHFGLDAIWEQGAKPILREIASLAPKADRQILDALIHQLAFRVAGNPEKPQAISLSTTAAATDRYVWDAGVHGIAGFFRSLGNFFRTLQSGKTQSYLLISFLVLTLFLLLLLIHELW